MENDEPSVSDTQQVTIDADSAGHSAFVLIVGQGTSRGATLRLDGNEGAILVGNSPVCTLRLEDAHVSRRHLSLEVAGSSLRLIDLGSTNGTVVGTLRVGDALLSGGETIAVGDSVLSVT